jgi:cationic amino acid transporter 3
VILSFLLAAVATYLSGLSYAELASKVPRSGSAYVYIYVTIGEFAAFIMGWDLILEYVIGVAASANALSQYINSVSNDKIKLALESAMPMYVQGLAPYPDFLATALSLVVMVLLLIGVKESTLMNKLFTVLNVLIISFITITGAVRLNSATWRVQVVEVWRNNIFKYYFRSLNCFLFKGKCHVDF